MEIISCEYEAAYVLVCELAARLEQGQHFRDKQGRALLSLDEVIQAILEDRWPAPLTPRRGELGQAPGPTPAQNHRCWVCNRPGANSAPKIRGRRPAWRVAL